MLRTSRSVVVWNGSAGTAGNAADVRDALSAMPNVVILEPDGREAAIDEVIRAAECGAELIVAAGGDGTVSAVVEGIIRAESRPVLGIQPLGTGNDLARSLGVPLSPREALAVLESGRLRDIDAVDLTATRGKRICANMLTGGNTGRYLGKMTVELKERWGPFCYLRGVLDVLRDLQTFRVSVACDDGPSESFDAVNVFVSNGRFSGGGLVVSPQAELDDGHVDLVIIREGHAGGIVTLASQYVLADYLEHELTVFRRARRLVITSDPAMPLTADGDEVGNTPLSVTVRSRCLRVLVAG